MEGTGGLILQGGIEKGEETFVVVALLDVYDGVTMSGEQGSCAPVEVRTWTGTEGDEAVACSKGGQETGPGGFWLKRGSGEIPLFRNPSNDNMQVDARV